MIYFLNQVFIGHEVFLLVYYDSISTTVYINIQSNKFINYFIKKQIVLHVPMNVTSKKKEWESYEEWNGGWSGDEFPKKINIFEKGHSVHSTNKREKSKLI